MLLNLIKRDGTTEVISVPLGANLHGLRATSIVIESREELVALATETGVSWMLRVLAGVFYPTSHPYRAPRPEEINPPPEIPYQDDMNHG